MSPAGLATNDSSLLSRRREVRRQRGRPLTPGRGGRVWDTSTLVHALSRVGPASPARAPCLAVGRASYGTRCERPVEDTWIVTTDSGPCPLHIETWRPDSSPRVCRGSPRPLEPLLTESAPQPSRRTSSTVAARAAPASHAHRGVARARGGRPEHQSSARPRPGPPPPPPRAGASPRQPPRARVAARVRPGALAAGSGAEAVRQEAQESCRHGHSARRPLAPTGPSPQNAAVPPPGSPPRTLLPHRKPLTPSLTPASAPTNPWPAQGEDDLGPRTLRCAHGPSRTPRPEEKTGGRTTGSGEACREGSHTSRPGRDFPVAPDPPDKTSSVATGSRHWYFQFQ